MAVLRHRKKKTIDSMLRIICGIKSREYILLLLRGVLFYVISPKHKKVIAKPDIGIILFYFNLHNSKA